MIDKNTPVIVASPYNSCCPCSAASGFFSTRRHRSIVTFHYINPYFNISRCVADGYRVLSCCGGLILAVWLSTFRCAKRRSDTNRDAGVAASSDFHDVLSWAIRNLKVARDPDQVVIYPVEVHLTTRSSIRDRHPRNSLLKRPSYGSSDESGAVNRICHQFGDKVRDQFLNLLSETWTELLELNIHHSTRPRLGFKSDGPPRTPFGGGQIPSAIEIRGLEPTINPTSGSINEQKRARANCVKKAHHLAERRAPAHE
ncbi:hypothetical protein EVAR_66144_1 [Eumeta japonica]|uniref:Uncharacterized protein n=1 Tax=Eumeta variegata TaxID=151549 RepID=A0A4C1Z083_EUMVA|nr:hypothetical protein EVAR_66144_1 [Eumeta japonica]